MTRRTVALVWAALVALPLLFGVVAFVHAAPHSARLVAPVFWLAAVASALDVALSRVLPPRLWPSATRDRDTVAFSRLLVGFLLCDAAALAPLVGFMVTSDLRLLALFAVDLVALLLLFPSGARWERVRSQAIRAAAARGVR